MLFVAELSISVPVSSPIPLRCGAVCHTCTHCRSTSPAVGHLGCFHCLTITDNSAWIPVCAYVRRSVSLEKLVFPCSSFRHTGTNVNKIVAMYWLSGNAKSFPSWSHVLLCLHQSCELSPQMRERSRKLESFVPPPHHRAHETALGLQVDPA